MGASAPGTAWLCDARGRIIEVLRDDLNLCLGVKKGTPLSSIVVPAEADRADAFIAALLENEALFDYQMEVVFADRSTPMHFAGGVSDDYLTVVATLSRADSARIKREVLTPDAASGGSAPATYASGSGSTLSEAQSLVERILAAARAAEHDEITHDAEQLAALLAALDG